MRLPVARDAMLLAASQAARVLGPGVAMLILAAQWEPAAFGAFASHFALAGLIAFLPAAGLSAFLLDQGGRAPGSMRPALRLCDRFLLLVLALPLAAGLIAFALEDQREAIPVTLYLAMTLAAFAELRIAAFRGMRREREAFPPIILANGVIALSALLPEIDAWQAGLIWSMARGFQLIVLTIRARKVLPKAAGIMPYRGQFLPFIASQSAGVLYTHADTLLVRALLGEAAAGLYNAALRLLQLAGMAAQTLSQWFQPRMASHPPMSPEWRRQRLLMRLCLAAVAAGGLAVFTLEGGLVIGLLFGPAYAAAQPVLFLAGFVLAARCFVAGQWMELTARQLEKHRARDSWLLLAVFIVLAWLFALEWQAEGVMLAHLMALVPAAALSAWSLARAASASRQR